MVDNLHIFSYFLALDRSSSVYPGLIMPSAATFSNFSGWPMRVKITYYYGILSQPMRKQITKFWLYSECTTEQELCLREASKLYCCGRRGCASMSASASSEGKAQVGQEPQTVQNHWQAYNHQQVCWSSTLSTIVDIKTRVHKTFWAKDASTGGHGLQNLSSFFTLQHIFNLNQGSNRQSVTN